MYRNRQLLVDRLDRELSERVLPLVHPATMALTVTAGPTLDKQLAVAIGERWGAPWTTTWFRCSGEVPADWAGKHVVAIIDLGFDLDAPGFQCEGLVREPDGTPVQGIHPRRTNVAVADTGTVDLVIEAASNPTFRGFAPSQFGRVETAGDDALYVFGRADLVVVDPDADELLHDFELLDGLFRTYADNEPRAARLGRTLERGLNAVAQGAAPSAVRVILADALGRRPGDNVHRVVATGHAHIDSAWLWPIRETKRKCVRTFTSAVTLMDDDPDYVFSCSQAQQYEWLREAEPAVFERVKEHVRDGQWVPVGGMWVEADMNLPSGESLARQIVHGQRYFEEHFGVRCTEMWVPDVFGYPAGMPELFAAGGMSRFVTQKLSWNRTNKIPHHTFWWEGLDGTRVLTHFPPVDTYNSEVSPRELAHAVSSFAEHGWSDWSLLPFGYGDGGGGPTAEMLARARRMADLDGMPKVTLGSPAEFFDHVEAELAAGAEAPVWRGELYFETHRGTLTSQLRTKEGNRTAERLLREAELLDAIAAVAGVEVDPHALDESWRAVLTQQFHDIIPGSSIGWVHDDAEAVLGAVADDVERKVAAALDAYGGVVLNSATSERLEVVTAATAPTGDGRTQVLADGSTAFVAAAPALGLAALSASDLPSAAGRPLDHVVVTDRTMANEHLAISWDSTGRLVSVIDAERGRELLSGPGAVLELAVDHPVHYDAWDVESWTIESGEELTATRVTVQDDGPLVGSVAVDYEFGPSRATVRYVVRAGSPRVDVEIEMDWQHVEHLLSMRFPLDVRTDNAMCGVQFGAVARPTHPTTSWDAAKFEVCAHRYVDLAEPDFGVAVLDNGRYGHGLLDGSVRVSLARHACFPDPEADRGEHRVTLALLPHGHGLADVVAEAERLALPLRVHSGAGDGAVLASAVTVAGRGVEVDTVKVADDGSGDLVVRFHEATGNRSQITVSGARSIAAASACNLLEEPERSLDASDGIVAMTLRPFQLVTLRLTLTAA